MHKISIIFLHVNIHTFFCRILNNQSFNQSILKNEIKKKYINKISMWSKVAAGCNQSFKPTIYHRVRVQ